MFLEPDYQLSRNELLNEKFCIPEPDVQSLGFRYQANGFDGGDFVAALVGGRRVLNRPDEGHQFDGFLVGVRRLGGLDFDRFDVDVRVSRLLKVLPDDLRGFEV